MQNRMDAHSDHVCYRTENERIEKNSNYRCLLNGLWKFSYAKNMNLAVKDFEKKEFTFCFRGI